MRRTGASGGQQARADAQSRPWLGCALIVCWAAGRRGCHAWQYQGKAAVSRVSVRDTRWAGRFWPVTKPRFLEDPNEHF